MLIFLILSVAVALNCSLYGKAVTVSAITYYCNGIQVSKAQYDAVQSIAECEEKLTDYEVCVCPADYAGENCEILRSVQCALAMISPSTTNCNYSSDYNTKLLGYPNCLPTLTTENYEFQISLNCFTSTPGASIDNYYLSRSNIDEQEVVSTVVFDYEVNSNGVISSKQISSFLSLKFINYNKPYDRSGIYYTPVTISEIMSSVVVINVDLNTLSSKGFFVTGRAFFEIEFDPSISNFRSNVLRNVLDDSEWKMPSADQKFPTGLVVGLVVGLMCGIVMGVLIFRYFYLKSKIKE